jgi:hypothetical protein
MKPINLFVGYDEREAAGFHVFASSVIRRASRPVRITPLASMGLPRGSNTFTLSRFLVPALSGFKGNAIFVDGCDMMCLGDIAELADLANPNFAVQVVKHPDYDSLHKRKYIGTEMECVQSNYSRKNWASVMAFNCAHSAWFGLTPQAIEMKSPMQLLQFQELLDKEIGELPPEWNVLVDEGQSMNGAKLLHWTAGLPSFRHYRNSRGSADWFDEFGKVTQGMQDG